MQVKALRPELKWQLEPTSGNKPVLQALLKLAIKEKKLKYTDDQIKQLKAIFPLAWMLGVSISIDEMTMQFQGCHKDKKRITYKAEGDGFQCDALADKGYLLPILYAQ